MFRANYASHVGEPAFEELLAALLAASADFQRVWHQESTMSLRPGRAVLVVPRVGRLTVDSVRLTMPGAPGYILFVLLPADVATRNALARLRQRSGAHARLRPRTTRNDGSPRNR